MRKNKFVFSVVTCLTFCLSLASCGHSYSEEEREAFDVRIKAVIAENDWDYDYDENGMYFKVISEGEGDGYVQLTDKVTFSYRGSYLNGEVFQEITQRDALTFMVGELIPGWQDALSKVKQGGEIKVILPPYLGYGSKKTGIIPANSILVYDLRVHRVR